MTPTGPRAEAGAGGGAYYSYTQGNGPFHIWGEGAPEHGAVLYLLNGRGFREPPELTMPEGAHTVYTDRLWQWDSEKYDTLCLKHFGDQGQTNWHQRPPDQVSAFLSDYLAREVKAVACWQYNHAWNGFPLWLLFYRDVA